MKNRDRSPDLKILASHPVQYHVPFIREMVARGLDVEVTYYHQGTAGRMGHDAEFGLDFEWDLDLLGGYRHNILQSSSATYTWSEQTRVAQRLVPWVLRDQSPVLLMGWFSEITWLVWLLGVIQHVPILVLSETTPLSFRASYKPRWRVRLLSWLLRRSAACLYIGTRNRTFLSGMGVDKERLFHCPYSVDNSFFTSRPPGSCRSARKIVFNTGWTHPCRRFCSAGNWSRKSVR